MATQSSYTPIPDDAFDWLGRGPVPAAPYTDPAWFADEVEAVLKRNWIMAAHECEFPDHGSYVVREFEFARASILIVRGRDGVLRGFHNVCTHRGTQLVQDHGGKRSQFSCPYHRWTYGADGALLSAPDFAKFALDKADCALKRVSVESCGGLLFVNLDPKPAENLRTFLGPLGDELADLPIARAQTFTEYTYEIDANWKINYDNFQENYHLRFIHPNTGAAAIGEDNPFGYPVAYDFIGPHRRQTLWRKPDIGPIPAVQGLAMGRAAALARAEDSAAGLLPRGKVDMKLFPNLFVIGQAGYIFTHSVLPVSPARTRAVIRLYWLGEDGCASERFAREFIMATIRDVHAEDRGVVLAAQAGLSGAGADHLHFQVHEVLLRHFAVNINRRVEAWREGQDRP